LQVNAVRKYQANVKFLSRSKTSLNSVRVTD